MNYVYDIYLNLNKTLYDFFDCYKNDKIMHIKKMHIIKIKSEVLKQIITNRVTLNDDSLLQILKKTEIWNDNNKIDYCALFTDGYDIIGVEFDNKGNSIKKSYLFVDEELDVLEIIQKLKEREINFTIKNKEKIILKTRNQIKEEKFIYNELKNIEDKKLNYIYFECFGKKEKDKKTIFDNLNKISKNSETYKNLYNILKLTANK